MKKKSKKYTPLRMEKELSDLIEYIENAGFESKEEIDRFLAKMGGKKIGSVLNKKKTAADEAFELILEAQEVSPEEGIKLAKKAITLDPNCADAYTFIADHTEDEDEALELYQKAMQVARESLGENAFIEYVGHFWGITKTRPYMRAKAGYASSLILKGDLQSAIKEFQEMLVLNPSDNQGIRFSLSVLLLQLNRLREYEDLLKQYKDENSAGWLYNRVLYLYLKYGGTTRTISALEEAIAENKYVMDLITGLEEPPKELPESYGIGSYEEAVLYYWESILTWMAHKKAILWLIRYWERRREIN